MSEEVEFIRMGSGADFVNSGRVRIKVRKPKKGTKYKMEDHFMWVRPETLKQLQADGGETAVPAEFSPRKSPRVASRATATQQAIAEALPALAAIERPRKMHVKK